MTDRSVLVCMGFTSLLVFRNIKGLVWYTQPKGWVWFSLWFLLKPAALSWLQEL